MRSLGVAGMRPLWIRGEPSCERVHLFSGNVGMTQRLETGKSETYLDSWRCLSVRGSWCLAGGGRSMSLPGDGGCDAADGWRADEAPQAGGGSGRNGGGVLRELRRPVEDLFGDGDGDGGTDRSRDGRTYHRRIASGSARWGEQ